MAYKKDDWKVDIIEVEDLTGASCWAVRMEKGFQGEDIILIYTKAKPSWKIVEPLVDLLIKEHEDGV